MRNGLRCVMCRLSQLNSGKIAISSPKRGNQATPLVLSIALLIFTAYLMRLPPHFRSDSVLYPDALYLLSVDFYISCVVWLLLVFGLIWYGYTANTRYIYPLLVIIISIVFYGYWMLHSPSIYGPDGFYYNEISQYFLSSNSISVCKDLQYSQWPGFFILQAFLISIVGSEIVAHKILSLFFFLLLPLVFYRWLRLEMNHKLAFLGFLLFIQANLRLNSKPFASPYSLCLVFFLILLTMIPKTLKKERTNIRPILFMMLVIGFSLIISHPVTGIYLILSLGMYYLLARNWQMHNYALYLLVLLASWLTLYTFPDYIVSISTLISVFATRTFEFPYLMHYLKHVSGEQVPHWVTYQRLIVSLTIICLSGLWVLQFIKRSKRAKDVFKTFKKESVHLKVTVSLIFAILVFLVPSLLYRAGELSYYVWMFSLIPLCFLAARALVSHKKVVAALTVIFLLLLPFSFISNYYNVNSRIVREPELSAAEFLENCEDKLIVTDFSTKEILSYFSPSAQFNTTAYNSMVNPKIEFLLKLRAGDIQGDLFFYSLRTRYILRTNHGFDDQNLETLLTNMNNLRNRIYDNGIVDIFAEK